MLLSIFVCCRTLIGIEFHSYRTLNPTMLIGYHKVQILIRLEIDGEKKWNLWNSMNLK